MHQTIGTTTDNDDGTIDLPWNVTWNGIASIPMNPVDATQAPPVPTPTTLTCDPAACSDTSSYTIDGQFHVGGAGFTSVAYFLHLEGSVALPGAVPVAVDDSAKTIADNPRTIDVTTNDTSAEPLIAGSVAINTDAGSGTAVDNPDDTVTYTPNPGITGQDTFVYTVDNASGTSVVAPAGQPGEQGIVTVDVQTNDAPVATDDPVDTNPVALDQGGGALTIDVLANDSDANNDPGLPGGIDVSTVKPTVTNASGNVGTCTGNDDGTVTYSQTLPSVAAADSCTYTVSDIDTSSAGPLTSDVTTISINVVDIKSDWPAVLDPDIIPILAFEPGVGDNDQSIKPEKSWFSMQVSASQLIYTVLEPGPDGGFIIDYDQPATGSHTSAPNGTEQPGFTAPWTFFSNTGFDFTRNGGIEGNTDGTLEFRTRYAITWNGIEVINLGGSSKWPSDLGFATITCSDKPCEDGSTFVLEYAAHVEDIPGESSGFDNVPYQLFLEGTVRFLDGNLQTSNGDITNQTRVAASETTSDDGVDLQCAGSCFDYTIENVPDNSRVSIVLPLSGGIRNNPVWRILDNGVWRDFDTLLVAESVKTAPAIEGGPGLVCPPPDDAAYIDLENDTTVNLGHQCVQLAIIDNGPNDLNPALGIIEDPSGQGTAGTPEFEDTRGSDTSGCSIAATPVDPGGRADWWLLTAFLGWLGWNRGKRARR